MFFFQFCYKINLKQKKQQLLSMPSTSAFSKQKEKWIQIKIVVHPKVLCKRVREFSVVLLQRSTVRELALPEQLFENGIHNFSSSQKSRKSPEIKRPPLPIPPNFLLILFCVFFLSHVIINLQTEKIKC
jgi:hypothetical protein